MSTDKHKGERIAKRMARAGLCSRRDAERWIADGRVAINGQVLDTPATLVTDADEIIVDGTPLQGAEKTRLYLYHKPPDLVTSHNDDQGRRTVFDSLPKGMPRVISVGRLDLNTEGLLLLTNDGALSRYLELPQTAWVREYRVRVFGALDHAGLADLKNGITIEGVRYKSIDITIENEGKNSWLNVKLTEGKNREIRRVMRHMNLQVSRLIRTDYGPFSLGNIPMGTVEEIDDQTLKHKISGFFK